MDSLNFFHKNNSDPEKFCRGRKLFYYTNLLGIENLLGKYNLKEIRANEDEIDRLYHLTTKVISLSLTDSNVLSTSQIKNISLIPCYLLISKRLENIGDNLKSLAVHIDKNKVKL